MALPNHYRVSQDYQNVNIEELHNYVKKKEGGRGRGGGRQNLDCLGFSTYKTLVFVGIVDTSDEHHHRVEVLQPEVQYGVQKHYRCTCSQHLQVISKARDHRQNEFNQTIAS